MAQAIYEKQTLRVSCVTFNLDYPTVFSTLESLWKSCSVAQLNGKLEVVNLFLIDNGPSQNNLDHLLKLKQDFSGRFTSVVIKTGHGNVGYGAGHNIAIKDSLNEFHLVLNPDVILDLKNIDNAISRMIADFNIALIAPAARDQQGATHYIAKRYPSLRILLSRFVGSSLISKWLEKENIRYEYRDLLPTKEIPIEIELASGCYMFCRTSSLQCVGGFNDLFFMYFEDFDLSIRLAETGRLVHDPLVKIVHLGGHAGRKGFKSVKYFISSLIKFMFSHKIKF